MAKIRVFSGNCIKILACAFMLIDHIGLVFFPQLLFLRAIGRLAFPLFAFLLAEGCRYTKNKLKHFLTLFFFAVLCQLVYFLYDGSLYMCIFVTFTLAEACIFSLQYFKKRLLKKGIAGKLLSGGLFVLVIAACCVICRIFTVDYGLIGVLFPVICSLNDCKGLDLPFAAKIDNHWVDVGLYVVACVLLCCVTMLISVFSLLSVPFILCYNGKRGKYSLKYFFYVFYPLHLVVLQGLAMLL